MSFSSGSVLVATIAHTNHRRREQRGVSKHSVGSIKCDMVCPHFEFPLYLTMVSPMEPALLPAKTLGSMCFSNRALHTPCAIENKSILEASKVIYQKECPHYEPCAYRHTVPYETSQGFLHHLVAKRFGRTCGGLHGRRGACQPMDAQ